MMGTFNCLRPIRTGYRTTIPGTKVELTDDEAATTPLSMLLQQIPASPPTIHVFPRPSTGHKGLIACARSVDEAMDHPVALVVNEAERLFASFASQDSPVLLQAVTCTGVHQAGARTMVTLDPKGLRRVRGLVSAATRQRSPI